MKKRDSMLRVLSLIVLSLSVISISLFVLLQTPGQRYKTHVTHAVHYAEAGDFDQAIVEFEKAIEINSSKAGAYAGTGEVYNLIAEDAELEQQAYYYQQSVQAFKSADEYAHVENGTNYYSQVVRAYEKWAEAQRNNGNTSGAEEAERSKWQFQEERTDDEIVPENDSDSTYRLEPDDNDGSHADSEGTGSDPGPSLEPQGITPTDGHGNDKSADENGAVDVPEQEPIDDHLEDEELVGSDENEEDRSSSSVTQTSDSSISNVKTDSIHEEPDDWNDEAESDVVETADVPGEWGVDTHENDNMDITMDTYDMYLQDDDPQNGWEPSDNDDFGEVDEDAYGPGSYDDEQTYDTDPVIDQGINNFDEKNYGDGWAEGDEEEENGGNGFSDEKVYDIEEDSVGGIDDGIIENSAAQGSGSYGMVIEELVSRYGECSAQDHSDGSGLSDLVGLSVLKLVDLDFDGRDELIAVYSNSTRESEYYGCILDYSCSVYTMSETGPVLVYDGINIVTDDENGDVYLQLASDGSRLYIVSGHTEDDGFWFAGCSDGSPISTGGYIEELGIAIRDQTDLNRLSNGDQAVRDYQAAKAQIETSY